MTQSECLSGYESHNIIVEGKGHEHEQKYKADGAIIVDQDFFEALGFKHYKGTKWVDDNEMRDLHIDRIYDTFIDEDELRICDGTCAKIFDGMEPKPYSSREFLWEFGRYLENNGGPKVDDSVVWAAYKKNVPIFVPAFSDCSRCDYR